MVVARSGRSPGAGRGGRGAHPGAVTGRDWRKEGGPGQLRRERAPSDGPATVTVTVTVTMTMTMTMTMTVTVTVTVTKQAFDA